MTNLSIKKLTLISLLMPIGLISLLFISPDINKVILFITYCSIGIGSFSFGILLSKSIN